MPGLFGGIDDDTKLGLLTAALAAMSARGVRPGTALAQGGLLGINAMQQAKELRADEARKKMQEQLWQAQMAETMAQADERRAKIARDQEAAQRQAKIAAGAPRVGVPEFNTGTPGYSSGVSQAFDVPEAKPADTKVDLFAQLARKAAYLADNNDVASAEKYVDLANKMKPKYSPTLSVVLDPATNKHILVQASETEMPRPVPGMLPERKVELKDFGGSLGAVDMRDLMPGASFPKTQTFADRIAAGNLAETKKRRQWEQEGGAGEIKQDAEGNFVRVRGTTATPVTAGGAPLKGASTAKNPPEAFLKQSAGIENLNTAINEYVSELSSWNNLKAANPSARATMGTKYNNMMLQAKEAYNLGVLNGPDYMILTQTITNPMSMTGMVTPDDALAQQARELQRIMGQNRANLGKVYNQKASGQISDDPLGIRGGR